MLQSLPSGFIPLFSTRPCRYHGDVGAVIKAQQQRALRNSSAAGSGQFGQWAYEELMLLLPALKAPPGERPAEFDK